ncbi:MAG TPA: CBS domain-containing protein [Candidatus Sulfotelmatobacter sp.]|nr:CBS domain-containing protein [Candidatus Sulfotelmatobacter sp.]
MITTSVATQPAVARMPLKARDVMQHPVIAATPRASLRDIASQIINYGFSGMPVTERDGKVLGVITEADIVFSLIDGHRLESVAAADFMTSPPVTVDVATSLEEVMRTLQEHRIVRVPVTENGKLVGIISRRDVIRAVLEPEFNSFGTA